jgi:hypothetical protein
LIERRDQVFGKAFRFGRGRFIRRGAGENPLARHRPTHQLSEIPIAAARQQSEDVAVMFEWFDRVGADADIAALRRDF